MSIAPPRLETSGRLRFLVAPPASQPDLRAATLTGLSSDQKFLPSRFLYDELGSALFEAITLLPEYYLTRAETSILRSKATEIVNAAGAPEEIVEFGSGSSTKTRLLLNAAFESRDSLLYAPIDISTEFLRSSSMALLQEYPNLQVLAVGGEYRDAMNAIPAPQGRRLYTFLGSNIGNFSHADAERFLKELAEQMSSSDSLLVGIDLAKSPSVIEAAYNDAVGVTAAFNKNLLARINRDLGGEFDLRSFIHFAPYLEDQRKVEMRLVSTRSQWVRIEALQGSFRLREGESIHTEDSYKYTVEDFSRLARQSGLTLTRSWLDDARQFALALLTAE